MLPRRPKAVPNSWSASAVARPASQRSHRHGLPRQHCACRRCRQRVIACARVDDQDPEDEEDWFDEWETAVAEENADTASDAWLGQEGAEQEVTPSRVTRDAPSMTTARETMEATGGNPLAIAPWLAGAAAAVIAAAFYFRHKRGANGLGGSDGSTEDGEESVDGSPIVPKGAAFKPRAKTVLAAESRTMLNQFIDELRTSAQVDLSGKNLMDEGVEFIAEGLAFNSTCKVVRLGSNMIGVKACSQVAEVLKTNDTLEELHLDTNQIDDDCAEALAQMLAVNKSLKRVNLSANRIGDVGMAALAEMLTVNTTLQTLDLSSNEVMYDGAVALAKALTHNKTLTHLAVSDNYVGTLGSSTIATAVGQNSAITTLALKGCELQDAGVDRLCTALLERDAEIEVLDLGNNGISAAGAEHIARLVKSRDVKELRVYLNDLQSAGMYPLAKALKERDTLTHLDLSGNAIGGEGARVLMGALRGKENLTKLNLGYNPLGEEGTKAVVDVLKYDLPLTELKMGWCQAGDRGGAEALGQLLQFNECLEEVDFSGNRLGDNGAMIIGRAMRQMQTRKLRKLELGFNEIADDGCFTIANAFKNNPESMPEEIALQQNYIGRDGRAALQEAMEDLFDLFEVEMTIQF